MTALQKTWAALFDSGEAPPTRLRDVHVVRADAMARGVVSNESTFAQLIASNLAVGDVYIIRGVFEREQMRSLQQRCAAWMAARPSAFHQMVEGCPDFHRIIDLEAGRKYAFPCCKHAAYFYRWNDDPLGVWPLVTPWWRIAKELMGLDPEAYEYNTPSDGVVDRVQVVRYPPAIGYLAPHQDPHLHQRLFFSVYMSKRGEDFHGGGFYLVDGQDKVSNIEHLIEPGDACLGYATLVHGVAPVDRDKAPDWNATDGRWFLSLYSNASDAVPQRHTGKPVDLKLEGVLPEVP